MNPNDITNPNNPTSPFNPMWNTDNGNSQQTTTQTQTVEKVNTSKPPDENTQINYWAAGSLVLFVVVAVLIIAKFAKN